MDDYISRKEAVDWFMSYILMDEDTIPADTVVSDLKSAFLPADVEPVRRWIPCSERLPEINGEAASYLAYVPSFGAVDIADYHPDVDEWDVMGLPVTVTHWLPLPEPPEKGDPGHG